MTTDFDIAIIGAGPAGCACALALHGCGLRVALLDKESFPRDKICGDAIPGASFKAMDKINIEWGKSLRQLYNRMDITTSNLFAPNEKVISLHWVNKSFNSKRIDFDNYLVSLVKKET